MPEDTEEIEIEEFSTEIWPFFTFAFRLTLDNRANAIVPAPLKSNRARINVSGTKFETFFATLEKYPGKVNNKSLNYVNF